MGRNTIPKLSVWRDGALYEIRTYAGKALTNPGCGEMILYTRTTRDGEEILAMAWADGLCEMLASFYQSGFNKGHEACAAEVRKQMRAALGIRGGEHE